MSDTPKKRAHVISSFKDHGTGQSFAAGSTVLIDHGSFANYQAAGLVDVPKVETKTAKPKTAKPKTAKPKASKKSKVPAGEDKAAASSPALPTPPATRREVG